MAHLSIEYSENLAQDVDIAGLCDIARQALIALDLYPKAGLRIRAFRADAVSIADGNAAHGFADMVFRIGPGRSEAEKARSVEHLYTALEDWLKPRLNRPFALSLELVEINYPFAQKRLNTIRDALDC